MMMNRRAFSAAVLTGAAASLISRRGVTANATPEKARNVVLVHGLFADGLLLVRSDSALAGGRTERHLRAKPLDHAA